MKYYALHVIACFLIFSNVCIGQTTKEEMLADLNKTGGVYYAYPVTESDNSEPPTGYKPFYISHYGRHGSRYLISTDDYIGLKEIFHKADNAKVLTPLGKDVMARIDSVLIEAEGRGGDLSPIGVRQHREIAERMYKAYPEVFEDSTEISARSTLVVRCVLSMDAFSERLKELNPNLKITREASQRYMPYMCYSSPESDRKKKELRDTLINFKASKTNPERLMKTLFSDENYVNENIEPAELMWSLYYLASDMQDMETDITFYDIFLPDELFDLWQVFNFDFYYGHANYPPNEGLMVRNAGNLLTNIIETADEALERDVPSATLRFGHDGNLIPLAAILEFKAASGKTANPEDVYKIFADYKVAPMAGNIQLIFFKHENNPDAPILVKMMLNEEEQTIRLEPFHGPFYDWEALKAHYRHSKYM